MFDTCHEIPAPKKPQDLDLPLPFPERVRWVHHEVAKTFGRSDSSAVLIQVPFMNGREWHHDADGDQPWLLMLV